MRKRRGFSFIEIITVTGILALVVVVVVRASISVAAMKKHTGDITYLAVHNMKVMEDLRNRAMTGTSELLSIYGGDDGSNDEFSSIDIKTVVLVDSTKWGTQTIYRVKMESKLKNGRTKLESEFVITTIGANPPVEESDG